LVTERGALTETPAMLAFIAQAFPAAKLAPLDDVFAFAPSRPSMPISARPCIWPARTVCAAIASSTPTMRTRSRPCRSKVPQSVFERFEPVERELSLGKCLRLNAKAAAERRQRLGLGVPLSAAGFAAAV
jgi:glutathione S-transferase